MFSRLGLVVAIGCGSPATPNAPSAPPPSDAGVDAAPTTVDVDPSVPVDLRRDIARAETIGAILMAFDGPAAAATDVVIAEHAFAGIIGYLPLARSEHSWEVDFFVKEDPPTIGHRVRLGLGEKTRYEKVDPGEVASESVAAMFRARQLVIASVPKREIIQPFNPVVFPAPPGETGLLVYLLAGTTKNNVMVLGRHWRARTTIDGGKVLEIEPMSNGPIEIAADEIPEGATRVGAGVTHVLTDYPLETHVFASLLYRLPITVGTKRGIWQVEAGRIKLLKAR